MKKMLLILVMPCLAFAAGLQITQQVPGSISLEWNYDGVLEIMPSEFDGYLRVNLNGSDYLWQEGEPHLPVIRVALCTGKNPQVSAIARDWTEYELEAPIIPSQPLTSQKWPEIKQIDQNLYNSPEPYPDVICRVVQEGILHGDRFSVLELCPVRYIPLFKRLKVAQSIEVNITSDGFSSSSFSSPVFDPIKAGFLANFTMEPGTSPPAKMMVICPEYYQDELEPWLQWRKAVGYQVYLSTPESLGGTASAIKTSLDALYDFRGGIDYLVIVGDVDDVPTFLTGGSDSPTDIDYGCVDGDDYVPDMLIGRISVENSTQLIELAQRIIDYEQFNYTDSAFAGRYLFGTTDDSYNHDMVHTVHTYVRDNYLAPLGIGYLELDGPVSTEADVLYALNDGYAYYYYYGHGWEGGLASPPLTTGGLSSLTNDQKFPFIVGNACSTNDFTLPTSFGEALLRQANAGAIGYIGGSASTYWDPDSVWEIETFRAFLQDSVASVMGQCYLALLEVMVSFPSFGHYFFDVYNLIGDPSTRLWAGIPKQLEIEAPPAYILGGGVPLEIGITSAGAPLPNAIVCLLWSDSALVAATDALGEAVFELPAMEPDTILITATAFGYVPAQNELVPAAPHEPFMFLQNLAPSDPGCLSTRNDADGLCDFGETLAVELQIKNFGARAYEVDLTVSSADLYITLWDTAAHYPAVDNGEIIDHLFYAYVDPEVPNGHGAEIEFTISDSAGNHWVYSEMIRLFAPVIELAGVSVTDTLYGDGDYFLETGERVTIWFELDLPAGADLPYLNLYCEAPPEVDFARLEGGDTTLVALVPPLYPSVPFLLEITAEPDPEFPLIFSWEVFGLSAVETTTIFVGSPGFSDPATSLDFWTSGATGEWSVNGVIFNSPGQCFTNHPGAVAFYEDDESWSLLSDEFVVPWNAHLAFWYQLYIPSFSADGDEARVQLRSEGETLDLLTLDELQPHWDLVILDIPAQYYGKTGQIVWGFDSDGSNYRQGWYLDDIAVQARGGYFGDATVFPQVGVAGEYFQFGVSFGSSSGEIPRGVLLVVDGFEYSMVPEEDYDTEWSRFTADIDLGEGAHGYYFLAELGSGMRRFPAEGEFSGPLVGETLFQSDLEANNGGLTVESAGWYWGDPGEAHSGNHCWNNLGSAASYAANLNARLVWNLDLTGTVHPALSFWSKMDFARGSTSGIIRDGANLKIRSATGTTIAQLNHLYDSHLISDTNPLAGETTWGESWANQWRYYCLDLEPWAGEEIEAVFNTGTNDIEMATGWFLDDLLLIDIDAVVVAANNPGPETLELTVYPNPFNHFTWFSFGLDKDGPLSLEIRNIRGELISVIESAGLPAGIHRKLWIAPSGLPSGVYFTVLKCNDQTRVNKIILLK
ncbi:T9SS type A sorting domain-containing protein [bacterium]|nr:T9SS type A sorting domain-containing protein [bacterium]